jgi:hypothetical protein
MMKPPVRPEPVIIAYRLDAAAGLLVILSPELQNPVGNFPVYRSVGRICSPGGANLAGGNPSNMYRLFKDFE